MLWIAVAVHLPSIIVQFMDGTILNLVLCVILGSVPFLYACLILYSVEHPSIPDGFGDSQRDLP
jgi:hypothetical protein